MNFQTGIEHGVDAEFLQNVLRPYRLDCRYLRQAQIDVTSSTASNIENEGCEAWESLVAKGQFAIDRSCYIDDTGHFNAVEFNICYNQLAYVHLAVCVRERLIPALSEFDLTNFYRLQLSNYLIHDIHSQYHSQIDPRNFYGELRVVSARKRGRLSILKTHCRFYDDREGASDGEVKLAVLNP